MPEFTPSQEITSFFFPRVASFSCSQSISLDLLVQFPPQNGGMDPAMGLSGVMMMEVALNTSAISVMS